MTEARGESGRSALLCCSLGAAGRAFTFIQIIDMLLSPLLQLKDKVMAEMSNSNFSKTTTIQQAVCSCCGAIITSLFVTPLDVVKTRLQAQSNPFPKGKCFVYSNGQMDHTCVCENGVGKACYKRNGHFKGTLDAFVKIIQLEGIKSLWSGLAPTLIMALPTTIIYFTCYEKLSEALRSRLGEDNDHVPLVAGCLSRFGSVTVVSPLELIRTRMQYHTLSYKELHLSIRSKVARDGWLSLWRGWSTSILRDVPFSAVYWYNYEHFKKMMCKNAGAREPTFFIAFTAGAASGSIAAVITQPFDVVKTHRQTELWESETLQSKLQIKENSTCRMKYHKKLLFKAVAYVCNADGFLVQFDCLWYLNHLYQGLHPTSHRSTLSQKYTVWEDPQRGCASTWAVMRKIVSKKGIAGLFAGITPRLFKVAPSCAIMISTYEYGKAFFRHLNEKTDKHP